MGILVYKVSKLLGTIKVLNNVSFYVPKASLTVLVGPSGSGKSTLLRIIAGLELSDEGSIWLNDREATQTSVQYRKMGFLFQNYALFDHMTVDKNISLGLQLRKLPVEQISSKLNYLLEAFRISDIASHYPSQISGGQKQRVALARSLALHPDFLLLDEPFGALDGELRRHLSKWLKQYLIANQITAVMVTHDQKEAVSMADEILILKNGHLAQQGEPTLLYDQPINDFVVQFLGPFVEVPNQRLGNKTQQYLSTSCLSLMELATDPAWAYAFANRSIDKYRFFLRPHELQISIDPMPDSSVALVKSVTYKRHFVQLELVVSNFAWALTLQLGYRTFRNLYNNPVSRRLYIKPRPGVFLRAYPHPYLNSLPKN